MIQKIKTVDVLSMQFVEKDHVVMQAIVDEKMTEFDFYLTYLQKSKATTATQSENFQELARVNSPFETAIYKLVKRFHLGEKLSFPISLRFD